MLGLNKPASQEGRHERSAIPTGPGCKLAEYQFSTESRAPSSGAEQTANPAGLGTALFMLFAGCHLPQAQVLSPEPLSGLAALLVGNLLFVLDGNALPDVHRGVWDSRVVGQEQRRVRQAANRS